MKVALKEWGAITSGALEGRISVLVRKGGILEQREGFSAQHEAFWLYPTFLHQNAAELRPAFQAGLKEDATPGEVRLEAFCRVERVWKIESLDMAVRLEGFNALTAAAVARRFQYKHKPWVHALLLRVYRCQPHTVPETPTYGGCTSWVPLETDAAVVNAEPVMTDLEFAALQADLERVIENTNSVQ